MSKLQNTVRMFGTVAVLFGLAVGGWNYPPAVLPFAVYILAVFGIALYEQSKKDDND